MATAGSQLSLGGVIGRRTLGLIGKAVLIALSASMGAALVFVSHRFGGDAAPLLIILIPIALGLMGAVFVDPRFGVVLVFASFPLGFAAISLGPIDLQAVDLAVGTATALVVLRRMGTKQVPLAWAPPLWWNLLLIAWAFVSMTSAVDQGEAIEQVGSLASALVMATICLSVARTVDEVRDLLVVLLGVAVAITVPAIASSGELRAYYGGALVEGRLQGLFVDPNELGAFCSVVALVAAGVALQARTVRGRIAAAAVVGVLLVGLMLSLSRGAWAGTAVGLALLLVTLREARRVVAALSVPLVIAGFLIASLAPVSPQVQIVGARVRAFTSVDQPYDDRPDIWAEAFRQIRDDPWTGQGPGNFGVASRRLASAGLTVAAAHAHNLYLNVGAELGIPALLFLLAFLGAVARKARDSLRAARKQGRREDRILIGAVAAALVSVAVQGIFNNFIGNAIIDATTWGLVGLLLAMSRHVLAEETTP